MGQFTDLFRDIYRDFVTDGVQSSGTHKPVKAEIREIGEALDDAIGGLVAGIVRKEDVRVATTANGTLASAFDDASTVDGITLATGDRILIKNQTTATENGIYVVAASGAPTRATDANENAELPGATVFVREGTTNKGTTWTCNNSAVTLGSTDITFVLTSEIDTSVPSALDALRGVGSNIASASTVDLSASTGDTVVVTGSTAIDSFGTAAAGIERTIISADGVTVNASANIITPYAEDIAVPADGSLTLKSLGSGVWQVVSFPGDVAAERATRKELIDEPGGGDGSGVYLTDGKVVVGGEVSGGAVLAAFKGDEAYIGELHLKEQDVPGPIRLTDEDGRIPDDASVVEDEYPSSLLPYFGPYLCGVEGENLTVHLAGLLADREADAPKAWMELTSLETRAIADGTKSMTFLPEEFGSNARLIIRPQTDDGGSFAELQLTVAVLPQPPDSPAITKRICYIGDSLLYRQGAPIISKKLETDWGMAITEVGTLLTESTATYPSGVLSEAKPGHALYDFVYFYGASGTQQPLADADIPYYLGSSSPAWSTTQKRNVNYWLRPEDVGDDAEDVVNGYVIDFAWGFSRMSLTAPDALVIDYFRNDSTGMTADEIEDFFYDHVMLVCRRWEADYGTSAPIFWIVPDCGFSVVSDQNFKRDTRDVAAMRGIYKASQDTTAKLIIVPAHALSTPYSQYDLEAITESADPITGAYLRNFSDPIHMTGGGRLATFEHSAMWVACGLAGLL